MRGVCIAAARAVACGSREIEEFSRTERGISIVSASIQGILFNTSLFHIDSIVSSWEGSYTVSSYAFDNFIHKKSIKKEKKIWNINDMNNIVLQTKIKMKISLH